MLFSFSITGSHSEEYTEFCLYSFYFVLSIFALMIIEFELNSIKCVDFLFLLFKFWIILDKNATRKNARSCHVGVYNWCNGILTLLGNYQQFGMSFMRSRKLQIYIQEKKKKKKTLQIYESLFDMNIIKNIYMRELKNEKKIHFIQNNY